MAHFEVGKKVICIHSEEGNPFYKKGKVYVIEAIKRGCKCDGRSGILLLLDGIDIGDKRTNCSVCRKAPSPYGEPWFDSVNFAPYDDTLSETTVDELLEPIQTHEPCAA